jgi:hypothetical protein
MSIFASDDFSSGTAGDNLTTDPLWISMAGTAVYSDAARARQSGTTTWAYYRDDAPSSANYSSQAVVRALTLITNASIGVGVRCQSGANTLYRARAQATTNTIRLEKVVAGATTLISSASQTWSTATDYTIKLDVSGSTLEVFVNGGSPVISDTDTAITTAGFAGIAGTSGSGSSNTTGWHLDNFQAEEAGGGVTGTLVAVEDTIDAFSSSGNILIQGSLTTSENTQDIFIVSGTVLVLGSLSVTETAVDIFTASGSDTITGILDAIEGTVDLFVASGTVLISGSLIVTESTVDVFNGTNIAPPVVKAVNSKWLVSVGTTSGTVQLQMASEVDGVDVTLQDNLFFLKYRKI